MGTENRLHPRAKIRWPAVIQTSTAFVEGQTQNLSLGGAFIQLSEDLQLSQSLPVVLDAKGRKLPCTVQVVWSDTRTPYSQEKTSGIGVRFTRMMLHDREFLHDEISGYLKAGKAAYIGERKNRMISWPLAKIKEKDKIPFPSEVPRQCPSGHYHISWSADEKYVFCWECNSKYPLDECIRTQNGSLLLTPNKKTDPYVL